MCGTFRILVLLVWAAVGNAYAQSADQQVVSVTDSPDPVNRGHLLTYIAQTRNNGPNAAVNGGLNISLDAGLTVESLNAPEGFTCSQLPNAVSCSTPLFAVGASASFTVVTRLGGKVSFFPNGQVSSSFFPSGTTPDPNPGNNTRTVQTTVLPEMVFRNGFESAAAR